MTHSLMRRGTWIALFAILLNALAPTLSYAMASQVERKAIVALCTSYGLNKVLPGQPNGGSDHTAQYGLEHCPVCLSGISPPPVFPVAATVADQPPDTVLLVVRDAQFIPHLLRFWSASHNRGPPAFF